MDWNLKGKFDIKQPQRLPMAWLYPEGKLPSHLANLVLSVNHGGEWNRALHLEVLRRADSRVVKRRDVTPVTIIADEAASLQEARELYPEYVITGWETEGAPVPYSMKESEDLCSKERGLPDWLMKRLVRWCQREANFVETPVDLEELGKNS